jgi:integrase
VLELAGRDHQHRQPGLQQHLHHRAVRALDAAARGMTLVQYLDSWVDGTLAHQVTLGQIRQTTADFYADVADLMIIPYLGRRRIDELKPAVLREWLATLRRTLNARGRPYSSRSVQIAHGVLRRALNDAVRDELIPRNVALLVKPGRVDNPAPQPLRPEEIRALLTEAQHDRLYPLWLLLVTLGLRRGEALALRWTDVDLDQGTLTVARSLQRIRTGELTPSGRRRGRLAEVPPKTAGSIRRIALPGVLIDALNVHRQQQVVEREAASYWGDDDLVFTSGIGTWLEPQNVYKAWHELCERAGVRRCRPHDLRHTAASILLLQGADMRVVMDVLGHTRMSTTSDLYTHVLHEVRVDAAQRMDTFIRGLDRAPEPE